MQGHPLVLSECFTTSAEEDGTKCGQKFANDKRISVVELGAVAVGNQSFYAALGGKKPIVSGVALLPVDAIQKNGFALFGTNDSVLGPWGTFAKTKLHAKTAAVIYPQVPGIDVGAKVEKTSLEDAGITTKLVGFDPNSTDLTGPLTAAGAQTADIVVPQSNAAGCVNVAKTLQQLGVSGSKVVSNPLCLSGDVAAGLGGDLAPWVYGIASTLAGDKTDKAAVPYNKAMAQLKQPKLARRRLGDRLLGPDPHDREDDEPDRRLEAHRAEVHDHDPGVQGPAGARRAEPELRQVPDRARGVQRPGAVLPVPGQGRLQAPQRLAAPAGQLHASGLAARSADEGRGRDVAAPPRLRLTLRAWTGTNSSSSRSSGSAPASLIAGIALGVVLTYRGSGIINLATGAVAMLGGYSYWSLKTGDLRLARCRRRPRWSSRSSSSSRSAC